MIGIASCEKPITAAAIRQLARRRKLKLDDKVFALLRIRPRGEVVDSRMSQISVRNLLEHKAGWQGEPINRAIKAARASGEKDPLSIEVVLGFLMTQTLSSDPGTKYEYCNSCYDTLRHVILKTSKKTGVDYFRTELFSSFRIDATNGFASPDAQRKPGGLSIVWNDRDGGPVERIVSHALQIHAVLLADGRASRPIESDLDYVWKPSDVDGVDVVEVRRHQRRRGV